MIKPVLDMTAGGRMMWVDKSNPLILANDIRSEVVEFKDKTVASGVRTLEINPDLTEDWSSYPKFWVDVKDQIEANSRSQGGSRFDQIMFDPPHLLNAGENSWLRKKYGVLNKETWRRDLSQAFHNATNLLNPHGTLLFKWNSDQIPLKEVLALVPDELVSTFQNRNGKTYLIAFIKVEVTE